MSYLDFLNVHFDPDFIYYYKACEYMSRGPISKVGNVYFVKFGV